MFEIGWTEIALIAVVAIVVIGPKDLPRAMRLVGQWTGKMRRMAGEFQRQFNQALKEAELDDVHKEIQAIAKGDAFAGLKDDVRAMDAGLRNDLAKSLPPASPSAAPAMAPAAVAPAVVAPAVSPEVSATTPVEAAPTANGEP